MSYFGKHGIRCDKCGKFANNLAGEYVKKDHSCGYIWLDGETDEERNVAKTHTCEECLEKASL